MAVNKNSFRVMQKRILILKACGSKDEPLECESVCKQAKMYGIEPICKEVTNNTDLDVVLSSYGSFDYIYLSAHGCAELFASEDQQVYMNWEDFASMLCSHGCMKDGCILMLSCCRGGLMQVAYTLFYNCSHISYVLGPRQSLTSQDMHICFGIFLYNMVVRNTDPVVACERIKAATEQRFSCYDRQEEEINLVNYMASLRLLRIEVKDAEEEMEGTE